MDSQKAVFDTHLNKLERDISIQEKGIASFQEHVTGDTERLQSINEQIALIKEELVGKTDLMRQGLMRKPEYLAVKRAEANLRGEAARIKSEIADSQQKILASEDQISRLKTMAVQQAVEDLQTNANELKDVGERITAARRVVVGLDIIAPVAGVVVKLNYFTVGGVIRPGNDILALLPLGDELIIEVNVRPQDIDHVKIGQEALVRLPALNQRLTPMLPGNVTYVSADAIPNEKKQNADNIYVARVRLDTTVARQVRNFTPTPGMPAEVFIKTGQRTFFEYLVKPVRDTMSRAFREVIDGSKRRVQAKLVRVDLGPRRLDVVAEMRWRWSQVDKQVIASVPCTNVSAVERRYGISPSLLFRWMKDQQSCGAETARRGASVDGPHPLRLFDVLQQLVC